MHIHILGVCGTFMGGVAVLAQAAGHRVTGCDAHVYPPMSTQLTEQGITLIEGFDADQIRLKPDLYVIGNVVSRGNPLMEAILDLGLPYVSGPQWLSEHILEHCQVLAVAGTHGKTTTASIAAWVLHEAGLQPGFLIGGVPGNFAISARLPVHFSSHSALQDKPWFVIEADEYDTAFFDKRSKFVHYHPRVAILNNLEYDHADIFPNLEAIITQFHHLVRTVPHQGLLVVNGRDDNLKRVLEKGCWTPVNYFGETGNGVRPRAGSDPNSAVDVALANEWGLTPMLGEHNRMNALAVIKAVSYMGIAEEAALQALQQFKGIKRRMEVRGTVARVTVYDDFAHHPTAIETTLAGLRKKVGSARILAVIEPRSNTMKQGVWADALAPSLAIADQVFCYAADLGWDVAAALQPLGKALHIETHLDTLVDSIISNAKPGDHILVMSNGGFGGIHNKILEQLAQRATA
jgi:UDP-N-acetylmuramate: L-alanyl-gamma-D-glutamyl-meso-diaminopimelate ligase